MSNKGDSLFALEQLEIIDLVIISSVMAMVLYIISITKTEKLYRYFDKKINCPVHYVWVLIADLLATAFLCLLLIAIAPQFHYFYYQQIIPNLPNQIVFSASLSTDRIIDSLVLPTNSSIADCSTGFVLWLCLISSFLSAVLNNQRVDLRLGFL